MGRSLVIVESPAKAKTINKYLGRNYTVRASYGHVMDLPKKELGIDIKDEFEPTYTVIPGKSKILNELKKLGADADAIYVATDPDREGEAIGAHLVHFLTGTQIAVEPEEKDGAKGAEKNGDKSAKDGKNGAPKKKKEKKSRVDRKKIFRVMFHEITPKAIKAAFEHAGALDTNLVDAQQARRVLDRLVGYKISPLLWDKVRRGLSAGRVQTVALRLIVDRERDIRAFTPKEYWTIHAMVAAGEPPAFEAKLWRYKGEEIEVPNAEKAQEIVGTVESADWQVASVAQKEKRRWAPPPFTTSKLQQAAYNRLRFSAKRTMMLAQRLYEGVELGDEGSVALITYMRTDSVNVSSDAISQVRDFVSSSYGPGYVPEKPNFFRSKKQAQEAHEAIRPTDVARSPDEVKRYLDEDMFKLYQLIWQRFVASQMVPAVFDQTTIDISAADYIFRASGSVMKFDGYLAAYSASRDDEDKGEAADQVPGAAPAAEEDADAEGRSLPRVTEGERLRLEKIRPDQHFTEPPPRYTEATLVKELEDKGIGRPSTYASIISTIVEREYVNKEQGRFTPTLLGEKVSDLLVKSFEDIFDVGFTARLEDELDEIEEGKLAWRKSVKGFWKHFEDDLEKAEGEMESYKAGIPTDEKCPKCEKGMLLERISRHGFFLGCERYPDCDYIRDISDTGSEEVEGDNTIEYCHNCGREMVMKRGRFGAFLACSGYPDCKTTRRLAAGTRKARQPDEPLDEKCPTCGEQLLKRHGRFGEFIGCSKYPKCKYTRPITLGIKCPKCGEGEFVRRGTAKGRGRGRIFYGCSRYPDCDYTSPHEPLPEPCPRCGAPFIVLKRSKHGAFRACAKEGCDWEVPETESQSAQPVETSAAVKS
ncbi:MAG TPA: type I DNA topoisomerase [Candidatus Acidoferrales bacterium]|nr:type I DNA topoisomerase [Candidatus Acidoferrales bacterium]